MRVKLVCGFLGSGKTTLLRHILEDGGEDSTAVLINEAGDVAIDGAVLSRRGGLKIVELPSGCLCCVLRADLVSTVREIYEEFRPARLLIEPSGIASPSNILEALETPDLQEVVEVEAVVGIIDATSFLDFYDSGEMGGFFLDQVRNSDVLFVNKVDLVPAETVERIEDILGELNETAVVFRTFYCRAPVPEGRRSRETVSFGSHMHLDTLSLKVEGSFDRDGLRGVLSGLASGEYGRVLRAKGIFCTPVGRVGFNYAGGPLEFEGLEGGSGSRFVALGRDLNRELLMERLLSARLD
ncbi:MAG: GTP-binding protein [Euryarchaeota archaeon]|nr:GTP-binding protein [Euryarchaeota archaeon]